MAIDDLPWRKFPRDAISNVKIRFIQKQLPPHLKHCALLFFTTAFCLADDYGAVDLEDGLVFADAMDIDNPDDIFLIAEMFGARGVLEKINEHVYVISDWDMPNRDRQYRTPLTAEQRREAVRSRLKTETPDEKPPPFGRTAAQKKKDVATENEKVSLQGACSDKKLESVATHREIRDKTNKRAQKENIEKKDTHTQQTAALAQDALCAHSAPCAIAQALTPEEKREREKESKIEAGENQEIREKKEAAESILADTPEKDKEAEKTNGRERGKDRAAESGKGVSGQEYLDTLQVLQDFFDKYNPLGYQNKDEQIQALIELTHRMVALSDKANTGEIIAINFCRCFKKLVEQHQYYKDMPILPSNLLKNGVFSIILGEVGRILKPKGTDWQKRYDKMVAESLKDRAVYGEDNGFTAEYKKYGIALDDSERFIKLLHAQKAAAHEKNTQEYVDDS